MPDSDPPVLTYAPPRRPSTGVFDIVASALAFAAAHWVAEYATDYVLVVIIGVSVYGRSPRKQFETDIAIETFFAACEFFVVLAAQMIGHALFSGDRPRRRTAWLAALVLGALYCWVRWGIWGLSRMGGLENPLPVGWLEAMTLSGAAALLISRWRWPAR
jgi:hypothetical protein